MKIEFTTEHVTNVKAYVEYLLYHISNAVVHGETSGEIKDQDGNKIGEWKL